MKPIDLLFVLAAGGTGSLMAASFDRWMEGAERGRTELRQLKEDLLDVPGLRAAHHQAYAQVGERKWEDEVKPDFMRALTLATVEEQGDPLPSARDVIRWAHRNPGRTRAMLEEAARRSTMR